MENSRSIGSTQLTSSKLFGKQCPKTKADKVEMSEIPYASTVRSLMYTVVCTKPDIEYVVEIVNRFMSNPGKEHLASVKWILWYLKDTSSVCL